MLDWLRSLRPSGEREGVELYHGSPRDPVWDYVLSDEIAVASLQLTVAPVVLVGHSHVALALWLEDRQLGGGQAPAGTDLPLAGRRSLLNPGLGGPAARRRRESRVVAGRPRCRDVLVPADDLRHRRRTGRRAGGRVARDARGAVEGRALG